MMTRARNPFGNHAWVYAAIMAIAMNVSVVPMLLWEENPDNPATSRRRQPKSGKRRTAVQRFLDQPWRRSGLRIRGVEAQYDDDISRLLHEPNPFHTQPDFLQMTALLQHTKGACFWLKTKIDGDPIDAGEDPTYLWPMNPDYFTPRYDAGTFIGWTVAIPWHDPASNGQTMLYDLVRPYQVVLHRFMDPEDPAGWLSPIAAAANGVTMDMAAMTYNRSVLMNGSKPGGLLMHEDDIDEAEELKLKKYWSQKHEGPQNANKLAILTGNFKYIDLGLSPKEMDYLEQRRWDRDEILGALGVSKSILSITDGLNYSVQQSQDKNFWDKKLLPLTLSWERTTDRALMFRQPDNKVIGFDYSRVEALKAGLAEKVGVVVQLTGPGVHMPPKIAFDVVGLDVPNYEGDDVCLIPPNVASSIDVIAGEVPTSGTPGNSDTPAAPGEPRQPRPADK